MADKLNRKRSRIYSAIFYFVEDIREILGPGFGRSTIFGKMNKGLFPQSRHKEFGKRHKLCWLKTDIIEYIKNFGYTEDQMTFIFSKLAEIDNITRMSWDEHDLTIGHAQESLHDKCNI